MLLAFNCAATMLLFLGASQAFTLVTPRCALPGICVIPRGLHDVPGAARPGSCVMTESEEDFSLSKKYVPDLRGKSLIVDVAAVMKKNNSPARMFGGLIGSILMQEGVLPELEKAFAVADSDADGRIDEAELGVALASTGDQQAADKLASIYKAVLAKREKDFRRDTSNDGDGKIDYDEYYDACAARRVEI